MFKFVIVALTALVACAAAAPGIVGPVAYANAPLYAAGGSSQIDIRNNYDGTLSSYATAPFGYAGPQASRYVAGAPAAYAAPAVAKYSAPAAFAAPLASPFAAAPYSSPYVAQYAAPYAAAPYATPFAAAAAYATPYGAHYAAAPAPVVV